jgi:hypothetical protein
VKDAEAIGAKLDTPWQRRPSALIG